MNTCGCGNTELVEEDVVHAPVVMLPSVDQRIPKSAVNLDRADDWRDLYEAGTRSGNQVDVWQLVPHIKMESVAHDRRCAHG